eukprot:Pompholyxophrys_punicea_v1_NODE_271_length_2436_cov_24.816464.p2 type:complete len:126 gc:universal NODE_271_length_2436_cov_24.816464:1255-878(-)
MTFLNPKSDLVHDVSKMTIKSSFTVLRFGVNKINQRKTYGFSIFMHTSHDVLTYVATSTISLKGFDDSEMGLQGAKSDQNCLEYTKYCKSILLPIIPGIIKKNYLLVTHISVFLDRVKNYRSSMK